MGLAISRSKLISSSASAFEAQRKNNFRVRFDSVINGDDLWLTLDEFPFPKDSSGAQTVRWGNSSQHYAGSQEDFGALSVQVRDYLNNTVAQQFLKWRKLAYNENTNTVGWTRDYKKQGKLFLLPPGIQGDNTGDVDENAPGVRTVDLYGCWLKSFDMGQFQQSSNGDQVMVSMEISIDYIQYGDGFNV